ncbi:MAG TPA: hypothetical protein VJH96_03870 [Patescibacteria group bacterium]|nr:hypothetical protein [Patescibacteria group bacterium]
MTPQHKNNVLQLIQKVKKVMQRQAPPQEQMMQEVKMMNFKVRPLFGDISLLMRRKSGFLEAVWRVGSIEETVAKNICKLDRQEQELFFRYLEKLRGLPHYAPLSPAEISTSLYQKGDEIIEVELIKEHTHQKINLN